MEKTDVEIAKMCHCGTSSVAYVRIRKGVFKGKERNGVYPNKIITVEEQNKWWKELGEKQVRYLTPEEYLAHPSQAHLGPLERHSSYAIEFLPVMERI